MHTQSSLLLSALLLLAPLIAILSFSPTAQTSAAQYLAYRGSGRVESEYRGSGRVEAEYRGSGRVTV